VAAELTPENKTLLDLVVKRVCHFEDTLGAFYRDGLWSRMDRLYHGWTQLRSALRDTRGQDRRDVLEDARSEFGHELFIPHAYAIVETVLPALLSNRPRILILPNGEASTRNVEHMKAMIDKQQGNISLELRLQEVVKEALIYGIGVGKSYWLRREGQRPVLQELSKIHPARMLGHTHTVVTQAEPLFDDPTFEHVRARDFGWDPFAANMESAGYAYHRSWRPSEYVTARLADPNGWTQIALEPTDWENNNGSAERYRQSVRSTFEAQAMPVPTPTGTRERDIHEVIEYHDRGQIVTVLDRKWVVSVVPNETNYGRLPFHIYRPTHVPGQMVGKGEIEPIEDLQSEMNQMRTDRRWSDLMSLNPVIFYNDGMIEPDTIKVGPGEMNAVNGDPNDIIKVLELKPPSNTSYRETAEIAADIVRASGISDTFAGGEGGSAATATGVQLQLARASARIQNKTRRAEVELIKPLGEHWVRLNQRHIIGSREVRVPAPPEQGQPERVWAQYQLGPNELAGNFDIEVDGGSTTPENVPQKRQDAQIKMTLMSSPIGSLFDPRQMAISILEDLGEKNPEAKLQAGMVIPPEVLDLIAQHLTEVGMDPGMAQQLVAGQPAGGPRHEGPGGAGRRPRAGPAGAGAGPAAGPAAAGRLTDCRVRLLRARHSVTWQQRRISPASAAATRSTRSRRPPPARC
jgi:hypothetical protein